MTTRRKAGFTLVELIITVTILIMMVAVAMPVFFQIIAQRRLTAAVERVAADLRFAQSRAVTRGDWHRLHSGADGTVARPGQYRLERSIDGVVWAPIEESTWFNLSTDYQGSSLQSITDFAGTPVPGFDVRFNSRGAIDNVGIGSAGIRLTVVAGTGATGTIQVLRTGAVRIQ